ncbi:hypothetical protein OEZ86_011772 [Tetradesmus obliquus]|nr:hypothetical protein OEZ86_011772 [Tetradesmus obliquus]
MEACLLVDVGCAVPQLLPARTSVYEVLEKGPFHSIGLPSGWILHWSSSSYQQSEVNSVATNLAKQIIKGDACLVHPNCVLGRVAGCLGAAVAAVLPMYTTCRAWRRAVLDDDQLLLSLRFSLNPVRPLKPAPAQHYAWHAAARQQHPALLLRACQLGNVSALVARARLLDACGCAEEAMRCWKRAAKAGHLEGQLVYGLGLYRGIAGLQEEPQDAHMWLLRALKQVQKPEAAAASAASSSAAPGVAAATSATQPAASAAAATPATLGMPGAAPADASDTPSSSSSSDGSSVTSAVELSALSRRVLAQAGLVLGYLAFDGEGSLKVDKAEATRYFRLAAGAGCREAEEVLGWVYNTGQYGAI